MFEQYDTTVRTNTVVGPGPSDAAVVRIKDTNKGLAVKTDCNGRYVYLNPRKGGQIAVAEAARNVVCAGGKPLAITNCLNFGNPYKPEVYWQFTEAVGGMGDACRTLGTPVTGGNVSFYNENPESAVFPTPTIGMLGLVEDVERDTTTIPFRDEGDVIFLLSPDGWQFKNDIGGTEYLAAVRGQTTGDAPHLDLGEEVAVQGAMLDLIRSGLVKSAHDVSDGGLAVCLAECALTARLGAEITLDADGLRLDAALFGEAQSRIVFTASHDDGEMVQDTIVGTGAQAVPIGRVGGDRLRIDVGGSAIVDEPVRVLAERHEATIPAAMNR